LGIYGCQNNLFNDLLKGGQFAVKKGGQFGVKMGGHFQVKLGGQFQRFFHYMPSFLLPMFRMIYVAMGGVILGTVSILSICGAVYLLIKAIKSKPEKEYIASVNRVDFDDRGADVGRKKIVDKSGNKENLDSGRVLTILLLVAVLVMVGIQTIFLFTIKFNTSVVITNNISVYSPVVWLVGGLLLLFIVLGLLLLINRWSKEDELQSIYTNKEQSYWQPVQVRPLIEIDWKFVAGVLSFIAAELVAYGLMRQATCGIVWHQAVLPVLILILLIVMVFVYYRFVKPDSTSSFSKNLIIASKLLTQLQLLTAGKRTPDINVLFGYSAYISKLLTEEGYELQLTGHGRELAEKTLNVFGEIELRRNVDSYNREKDKELEELVMYYTDYLNQFVKLYS